MCVVEARCRVYSIKLKFDNPFRLQVSGRKSETFLNNYIVLIVLHWWWTMTFSSVSDVSLNPTFLKISLTFYWHYVNPLFCSVWGMAAREGATCSSFPNRFSYSTDQSGRIGSADMGIAYPPAGYFLRLHLSKQLGKMHFVRSGFLLVRVCIADLLVLLWNPASYASYRRTLHISRLCMYMPGCWVVL